VAGHAVLAWLHRPDPGRPPGDVRILGPASSDNLAAHRDSAAQAGRPLAEGETIDLDRAPIAALARLPKVGPGLARTIAEYRTAHGPFGSLEALNRVPGVGDGLIEAIRDHASFSAAATVGPAQPPSPATPVEGREPSRPPGPAPPVESRGSRGSTSAGIVDLNSASESELERLPFVGPSLARRIVEYRDRHGPFASVDSLVRVGGVGPGTLGRIRDLVTVR
jgi:competence protein ComEA